MATKKVPLTIEIDGRKTVIGTAEVDEASGTVTKAVVDKEYSHLIQGAFDNNFSIGESPKDRVIREEAERRNVFEDRPSRRGEPDA